MTLHGSRVSYTAHGCRCPQCRQANTEYTRDYRKRRRPGYTHDALLTPCWCQRQTDYLHPTHITQGQTWTCGHPDCHPPKDIT